MLECNKIVSPPPPQIHFFSIQNDIRASNGRLFPPIDDHHTVSGFEYSNLQVDNWAGS